MCASNAIAQTFSNPSPITINAAGNAAPYPSTIAVAGGPASIVAISLTISNFSHTWPDDVDVLLVGPNGDAITVMSDCGNAADAVGVTYTFADYAAVGMVNTAFNPGGSYNPTDFFAGDIFPTVGAFSASAPAGTATFESVFAGTNANGGWSLYVVDDTGGDAGSFAGGWSITFEDVTPGCTNSGATNFDPNATLDDGSCLFCGPGQGAAFFNLFDSFGDGWNGATFFITNAGGTVVSSGTLAAGSSTTVGLCLNAGCYGITVTAGGFPEEVSWSLEDNFGNVLVAFDAPYGAPTNDIGFEFGGATGCAISGCTQVECYNYNQFASTDDGSCACPPVNDDCSGAIDVGCGVSVNGSTMLASAETGAGTCSGITVSAPGLWYRLIGTGQQTTVSTCASSPAGTFTDTKLHVYTGSCSNLVCVGANDDDANCTFFKSTVIFTAAAGIPYYVLVSEFGLGVGIDFVLTVDCVDCASPVINDDCASALPQPNGVPTPASLCCSNSDNISACNAFGTGYGVWYTMNSGNADSFDFVLANGSGPGVDPEDGTNVGMVVFVSSTGDCGGLTAIACCPAVGDVCAGSLFAAGIPTTQNTQYYFLVYTLDLDNCGMAMLTTNLVFLGCTDPAADNYDPAATIDDGTCTYTTGPANDLCANAAALTCNTTVAGSTGASTNTGAPVGCGIAPNDNGVWYTFTGNGQFHTISTCGSVIDSRIEVLSSANGCAGPFTCVIGENNDATNEGCGFFDADDASVTFISTLGVVYYVYITGGAFDSDGNGAPDIFDGSFSLEFQCAPVLEGCTDACACNYDPNANISTDTCDYFSCVACGPGTTAVMLGMNDTFGDGWNGATYSITDLNGDEVAFGSLDDADCSVDEDNFVGADSGFDILCLADGCYSITVGGGVFDEEVEWSLTLSDGTPIANGVDETASFTIGGTGCGCTDPGACNFDPAAGLDDGSCEFETCAGCTDPTACNFDPNATIPANNLCCFSGCVTLQMNDSFGDGWNGATAVITSLATGQIVGTGTVPLGSFNANAEFCLEDGCYELNINAGTWPGEISWVLLGVNGIISGGAPTTVLFTVGAGNCDPGCTEPFACNFDPEAGVSDCTLCEYSSCQGCTYPQATNYDPAALIDDGSCDIQAVNSCPADINEDGVVGVGDLIIFIAAFGQVCQ